MKRNIFMMAAVAILAMACTKEQQPASESQNNSEKVFLYASVEKTKAVVDHDETGAQKGTVTFEAGDKMSVWFQTGTETTGEGEEMTETPVGEVVEFTYESEDAAGFKFSADASLIPEGFTLVKAAYPAGSLNSKGVFSLIRDYTYDPDSMPIYVRADEVIMNENGILSADFEHNASVFKFTLGDIPAYAAGFVLESQKYARDAENNPIKDDPAGEPISITTKFPYKTGYSEDITLYSVAAHSSYLTRVYLIDGYGDEIEGSERKFKQSWNDVSRNDFIIMPRIDFKKAELRKDYINIMGVKWAKGNLRYDSSVAVEGNQPGWHLAPEQWEYYGYDVMSSTVSGKDYVYNPDTVSEMRISRTSAKFDHFNFGGIGKWSYDINNYVKSVPATEAKEISGKIFSDQGATVEVTGDARFASEGTDAPALYGDLAFWATKGKYKVPSYDEMTSIHNKASKIPGWCVVDGVKVWGCLFRCPDLGYTRQTDATANQNREFTAADLETGMFLPYAGRTAETEDAIVINQRKQMAYRSAKYIKTNSSGVKYYCAYYSNSPSLKRYDGWDTNGPNKNSAWSGAAGFSIRPVLVEESAE